MPSVYIHCKRWKSTFIDQYIKEIFKIVKSKAFHYSRFFCVKSCFNSFMNLQYFLVLYYILIKCFLRNCSLAQISNSQTRLKGEKFQFLFYYFFLIYDVTSYIYIYIVNASRRQSTLFCKGAYIAINCLSLILYPGDKPLHPLQERKLFL